MTDPDQITNFSEYAQHGKAVIEIKDLYKSFGDNLVLNGFNMTLQEGENLVVMGKSGSGKSVMIKCLVGLEKPDSGTVKVLGKEINSLDQQCTLRFHDGTRKFGISHA